MKSSKAKLRVIRHENVLYFNESKNKPDESHSCIDLEVLIITPVLSALPHWKDESG
jgi:hypothetical protein